MKRYFVYLIMLFIIFIYPVYAHDFDITGKNVILYNLNDDTILFEQAADEKVPIASLTKIMTSIVAIENINDLDEKVTIKYSDFYGLSGYATAGFRVGDNVTYRDLLYGVLLPSGAEAVNALVNNTLEDNFIDEMNNMANKLNLENTSFSNAIGKDDDNNYSTANDLATLLKYALKNEEFKKIFTTRNYITTNNIELNSTLVDYGKGLDYEKIKGSKTGFTSQAGRCLASISTINDVDYLMIMLNSTGNQFFSAIKDSLTIYNYYGDNYSYQTVINQDTKIKTIPINLSKEKEYEIYFNEEVKMYLENGTNEHLSYIYEGVDEIDFNTKNGTKLGIIKIYNNDDLLYQNDVYLLKDIEYYPIFIWIICFLIFLLIIMFKINKKIKKR